MYTLRIRDNVLKFTYTATVKAPDLDTAIIKVRSQTCGWGHCYIMSITRREKAATVSYFKFPQFDDYTWDGHRKPDVESF